MLAVVKTPHIKIRIEGQIPPRLITVLKKEYGEGRTAGRRYGDAMTSWLMSFRPTGTGGRRQGLLLART